MATKSSSKSTHETEHPLHAMSQTESSPYSLSSMMRFANQNFFLIALAAVLFGSGFVFGTLWTENKTLKAGGLQAAAPAAVAPQAAPAEAQPLSDADWKEITSNAVFTLGDKNAKVTMVEFTDYQCPFCGRHYTDTHKQLVDKYVKTGKMKIIYKDQALSFHPNANSAAQAVRCAVEQNKAEAMHDKLFSTQAEWSSLSGDAVFTKYSDLANAAGLDGAKVVDCVKAGKYKAKVDEDGALGSRVGAGGTPTFFIEKDPLVGAQPLAAFEAKIDAKLAGK